MAISIKQTALSFVCFLLCLCSNWSTLQAQEAINWLTWEEAMEKMEVEKRKIFVEVYTDWCTWCRKMDETTLIDLHLILLFINNLRRG